MKAHLELEFIGCNVADMVTDFSKMEAAYSGTMDVPRYGPQVMIVGRDESGITLSGVFGRRDYSRANSKGSRGVYVNYVLEEGNLYFVVSPVSWRSVEKYYAAVTPKGDVYRLTDSEAKEWLRNI